MIEIRDLRFSFGRKRPELFGGLSATFNEGCIYGLFGKNGTGKSTLTYLISGLLKPLSGDLVVNGNSACDLGVDFLADTYLVAEEFELPAIKEKAFIDIYAPFYPKFSHSQMEQNLIDFEVNCSMKLSELSMGQKKKFLMSFALASGCSLLLMDEPTNGMDIPSKSVFRKIVSRSMTEERIIIISTHQAYDLENLIDSVMILDNGGMLLNSSLMNIEKKLFFVHNSEKIEDNGETVYSNNNLTGYQYVMENPRSKESDISLEMLFNATVANPSRIKKLFE